MKRTGKGQHLTRGESAYKDAGRMSLTIGENVDKEWWEDEPDQRGECLKRCQGEDKSA